MADVSETPLPGVGVRHDFLTEDGTRLGVVTHRSGFRELLVYDQDDPDSCKETVRLDDEDSRTLSELLGGSQVVSRLTTLQQAVEGLVIDWLPIDEDGAAAGHGIGDFQLRTRTGVTIVAVLRGEQAFPAPGPEFVLEGGDTAVVVGTAEGVKQAYHLLRGA